MKKIKKVVTVIIGLGLFLFPVEPVYAVSSFTNPIKQDNLAELINLIVLVAYQFSGVVLLAMLMLAGLRYMTAGDDKKAVEGARKRIVNAIVGIIILFSTVLIVRTVGSMIGVDLLDLGWFL